MDVDQFLSGVASVVDPLLVAAGDSWQGWLMHAAVALVILLLVASTSFTTKRAGREWRSEDRRSGVVVGWSALTTLSVVATLLLLVAIAYVAWGVMTS